MKYKVILFFLFLAIVASTILSFIPINKACGSSAGCSIVHASQYESTFGIKNAHAGLVAFITLFIITFLHEKKPTKRKKQLILTGLIIGSVFALYFLSLQFFVIHAICKYCLVVDLGTLLSLLVFLTIKEKK